MKHKNLLLTAIATLLIAFGSLAQTNVYDDIIAKSSDHTYLKAALDQEGLSAALQDPNSSLTVFAPTNVAFENLAKALNTDIAGLLALTNLSDILKYHVVGSPTTSTQIKNGDLYTPLNMANTLKMTKTSGGMVYVNQANVIAADLSAENGVVHSINAVLLPNETVVDVALDNGFSTLATAVITAELLPALTDPFATFTVFAPTNEAFNKLAADLNTDLAGILALDNLADVLTYHVLGSEVLSTAIKNGDVVSPISETNTLKLSVHKNGDVFVNQAKVSMANVSAENGVVHVLDAVVLPNETVVDVALDNDFTTLVTAVVTAELLSTLSNPFAKFTVFAPTNKAFADLAAAQSTDLAGLLALSNLKEILLYHVVSGTVLSTDLTATDVATLNGATVKVDLTDGVRINDSKVTLADVTASNGVVHVIDQVLVPASLSVNEIGILEISIFPNPTTEFVRISNEVSAAYQIVDLKGTVVKSGTMKDGSINVSELENGAYMINLESEDARYRSRFIKL